MAIAALDNGTKNAYILLNIKIILYGTQGAERFININYSEIKYFSNNHKIQSTTW